MKRFASVLICALLLINALVIFAVPAGAVEKVVYVSDNGTGNGSSASNALSSLEQAYKALATTGGTIKVVDVITVTANTDATAEVVEYFAEPEHAKQITVTSADPANKAIIAFTMDCKWYALSGATVFENLKLVNNTFDQVVRFLARGNHITMGEGLEMYMGDTLMTKDDIFVSSIKGFTVQGITNNGGLYDGYINDSPWITIKSGVYSLIVLYSRNLADVNDYSGNGYLELLGDFSSRQIMCATLKPGHTVSGETFVYWGDSTIDCYWFFPGYDADTASHFTCNMFIDDGANLVNASGSTIAFVGATKVKVVNMWYNETSASASDFANFMINNYTITVAKDGDGLYINKLSDYTGPVYRATEDVAPDASFADSVVEIDTPSTEAPVVTDAPATEAPVTEAPSTEAPVTEAPVTDAPVTELPAIEAPATDAPATNAPVTDAPAVDAAEAGVPVVVILIIAVAAVIGGVVAFVVIKKNRK